MKRRGFTYIEALVTLLLLVLAAFMVTPQLKHLKEGRQIAEFKHDLRSVPVSARELAISRGTTVQVRIDSDSKQIVIEAIPDVINSAENSITSNSLLSSSVMNASGDDQNVQLRTIEIPNLIETSSFLMAGTDTESTSWAICFYPDGTSDSGGITFDATGYQFSLSIRDDSKYLLQDGSAQDLSTQKWEAGTYVQR